MTSTSPCPFCEIAALRAPAKLVGEWGARKVIGVDVMAFEPLDPVVEGHTLIIPKMHVRDAIEDPVLTSIVMGCAAQFAKRFASANIITSVGAPATQSVFHLHVHVIPRVVGDQLMVPWGTLHGENPRDPHRCKGIVALEAELDRVRSGQEVSA